MAADNPAFVLDVGDLTYGEPYGQAAVDQHFNDVMAWSRRAAYMPAWGNHEWENPAGDDLRNYKGRFKLPNPQTSRRAPRRVAAVRTGAGSTPAACGSSRIQSHTRARRGRTGRRRPARSWPPRRPTRASVTSSPTATDRPTRPACTRRDHAGRASSTDSGTRYSKYVLNLNGHSHDYERFQPIHGVTHITAGGGGLTLERPWTGTDSRTAFRAMHLGHLRVDVSSTGCASSRSAARRSPSTRSTCVQGSVIDSSTIGTGPPPPPAPPSTIYVDQNNTNCSNGGAGTSAQPFCSIGTAAARVVAGQTVLVVRAPTPRRSRGEVGDRGCADRLRCQAGRDRDRHGVGEPSPTASTCPAGTTSRSRAST